MMPNIVVCGLIAFYLKTPLFPSLSISTTPLPCSSASDLLIDLRYPSSPCQGAKTTLSFCYLPKLAFELTSPSSPSLSSAAAPSSTVASTSSPPRWLPQSPFSAQWQQYPEGWSFSHKTGKTTKRGKFTWVAFVRSVLFTLIIWSPCTAMCKCEQQ